MIQLATQIALESRSAADLSLRLEALRETKGA